MVPDLHIGIDAQRVIDSGQEIIWMDGLLFWTRCGRVRFAVLHASRDAGARYNSAVTVRPVVAAVRAVTIAAG